MYSTTVQKLMILVLALVAGCEREQRLVAPYDAEKSLSTRSVDAETSGETEWSEPVNLGPVINTAYLDQNPSISGDGLSLYFASDRPGGFGMRDLYVAHRASRDDPWQTPIDLGATVNSAADDIAPNVSADGRMLFFASSRPGGYGRFDLYVSRRTNPNDDAGWSTPINLGPNVNTDAPELGPSFLAHGFRLEAGARTDDGMDEDDDGSEGERSGVLYFSRGFQPQRASDLHMAPISREGEVLAPETLINELSVPGYNDAAPTIRRDGREIFFWSDRPGSLGADLWTSTRRHIGDPWSPPVRLGEPPNSTSDESGPNLSSDGRTLFFASARPGGLGSLDIWMTTRRSRQDR